MRVEYEEKKIISVSGNDCKRGEKYAYDEIINPRRTLTSTVTVVLNSSNNAKTKYLPVKTDKPISKDKIFDAMREINKIKIKSPFNIKMGDVIYTDFTETGINLVAGRDFSGGEKS